MLDGGQGYGQEASQNHGKDDCPDEKNYNEDRAEDTREQLQKERHAVCVREGGGDHFAETINRQDGSRGQGRAPKMLDASSQIFFFIFSPMYRGHAWV